MKKFAIAVIGLFALFALSACSSVSTNPDEVALHYKGGDFSSKKFADCVDSSSRSWDGPGDNHFIYPAGQRTFSFTGSKGSESKPISTKTATTGVNVAIAGFVTFTLKTDCDTLRKFHETVGAKYKAYWDGSGEESTGWGKFLNDYLKVPLDSTMDRAGLNFDASTLTYSTEAQDKFEEDVKNALPSAVKAALGDDFIKINAVQIKSPELPASLKESYEAKEKAKLDNAAQAEKNATARTKYDTFTDCKKVLSEAACIQLTAIEKGIPIYLIPEGSGVNLGSASGK